MLLNRRFGVVNRHATDRGSTVPGAQGDSTIRFDYEVAVNRLVHRRSNDLDLERVDGLRAGADAILVGMSTAVGDDPKLTVKSERLRKERVKNGLPENPVKVTLGRIDDLNLDSNFMTEAVLYV